MQEGSPRDMVLSSAEHQEARTERRKPSAKEDTSLGAGEWRRRGSRERTHKCLLAGLVLATTVACTSAPPWQTQLEAIGIRFISARELKAMLDRREDFVLVDARDGVWYRAGRIPGAISIPAEDAPLDAVDVNRPKRLLYPDWLPEDRGRVLAFYCGGPT